MLIYYADQPPVAMRGLVDEVEARGDVSVITMQPTVTGGFDVLFSNGSHVKVLPIHFLPHGYVFN